MADTLVLFTHPQSRGRTARWMLEEVGEPYKVEILDYRTSMKAAPYLAINPMGKVPALRHGDAVVTETAAICAYLADAFPQAGLAPAATSPQRAPYYRWMFFGAGPVESAVTNKALGVIVPPERERMVGYGSPTVLWQTIETALSNSEYLAGDRFSAADLFLGAQLGFGMMFGVIEKRPAFEAYWQRISSRPAHQRARERDDALAAELESAKA